MRNKKKDIFTRIEELRANPNHVRPLDVKELQEMLQEFRSEVNRIREEARIQNSVWTSEIEQYYKDTQKLVEDRLNSVLEVQKKKTEEYLLTEQDKKEIAHLIEIPEVERIVEKTETIREVPHNVTKDDVVTLLNQTEESVEISVIKGLRKIIEELQRVLRYKNTKSSAPSGGGGWSASSEALGGSSANGSITLSSANTWYQVPTTVPTSPYQLIVTQEVAVGTIRIGYSNSGTPSSTNGIESRTHNPIDLDGGQVVYVASSASNDQVNFTLKRYA